MGLTDPGQSPESRLLGAAVETVPDLAAWASPISHVTAAAAPLRLVHGTIDDGVPFSQSEELVAAYQGVGASIDLFSGHGAGHGFPSDGPDLGPALRGSAEFLVEQLVGQRE